MIGNGKWRDEIKRQVAGFNLSHEQESEIIEELTEHLNDDYNLLISSGATEEEAFEIALGDLKVKIRGRANLRREPKGSLGLS